MDAISDSYSDDKREGHNVGRVKRNAEPAHEASHPDRADGDRQKSEKDLKERSKVKKDKKYNGCESPSGSFDIGNFKDLCIIIKLGGSAGGSGNNRAQFFDEMFLSAAFPDVLFGVNLDEVFTRNADEAISERNRKIFDLQACVRRLVLQKSEGLSDI